LSVDRKSTIFKKGLKSLLNYIEDFLAGRGVKKLRFGGDPQNFLPGLPFSLKKDYLNVLEEFQFEQGSIEYDLYRNISNFSFSRKVESVNQLSVRRVTRDEEEQLYGFLDKKFPGRWVYEAKNIGRIPGGLKDYWLLWYQGQLVGFARSNTAGSTYKGPNVNWAHHRGDRYCGLGPLGISKAYRKKGWGLYLIAEVINNLREEGYQHLIIDWTALVDYYMKLGFKPCRKYLTLNKEL
jgi:GNAT superfamily N-acetyltransferase